MVPFWRQVGIVTVESQKTHIAWGMGYFRLEGRRVSAENYARMCGVAAVVLNLLAAGLQSNMLVQNVVTSFIQSTRTMPSGAVVQGR